MTDHVAAAQYYAGLPRFRVAVSLLLLDSSDRLLLVKPTYKQHWCLPGGVLNPGEAPHAAGIREIAEELGLVITEPVFLGLDWIPPQPAVAGKDELHLYLFTTRLDQPHTEAVRLADGELEDYRFVARCEVAELVSTRSANRIWAGLTAIASGRPIYLIDSQTPTNTSVSE